MTDHRDLEAIRAAARAVAAVMRGATLLDVRLDEPTVPVEGGDVVAPSWDAAPYEAGVPEPAGHARPEAVWVRQTPFDLWFVTFAGAWADAAQRWRRPGVAEPGPGAAEDAEIVRLTAEEWVARMREIDARASEQEIRALYREFVVPWERELSRRWSVIQGFADALLRGETLTDWTVRARVDVTSRWRFEEPSSPPE